ncbi:MAG: hypothetical protein II984_07435 [Clostridia bacterium]|nr:hypothetical protein [Clostridia bacterium]
MKRLLSFVLVAIFLVCLFSCNEKSTYENILSQLDKYEFDAVTPYDKENIAQIQKNLELNSLPTDVTNICHYFTRSLLAGEENIWVYVYEFKSNASAKEFKEKYADNWNIARIKYNVVVYGSFQGISTLEM